ncbi:MAG: preprotein translocase subunit TatA [Halanaeroarchaeum sp.]
MFPAHPAVLAVPGGIELAVIVLIFVLLFGVPLVLLGVLGYWVASPDEDVTAERVEALEAEVAELKSRLEDER